MSRIPSALPHPALAAVTITVLLAACDSTTESRWKQLADRTVLEGEAHGTDAGLTIDCSFSWILEILEPVSRDGKRYRAKYGGEVSRNWLDANGDGQGFFMDVYSDSVEVRFPAQDSFEVAWTGRGPVEPGTYWDAVGVLAGSLHGDDTGAGRYACAPLGVNAGGWVDTAGVVHGRFEAYPEPG